MSKTKCNSEDEYPSNGICCQRCPAGQFVQSECKEVNKTRCAVCPHNTFTATPNHMNKCNKCKICSKGNYLKTLTNCTSSKDTVCECLPGFYCINDECDQCQHVANCPRGEGVQSPATRTNNTKCMPCQKGTYSNVSDSSSPCRAHTRCEEFGRELKTPGNATADAVCVNIKPHCLWELPAGLWSGLVLTLVLVGVVLFWKSRHRSSRAVKKSVPATIVKIDPAPLPFSLDLCSRCQETCTDYNYKASLLSSDIKADCIHPVITPTKFPDSSLKIKKQSSNSFTRSVSEPQEDEWCET